MNKHTYIYIYKYIIVQSADMHVLAFYASSVQLGQYMVERDDHRTYVQQEAISVHLSHASNFENYPPRGNQFSSDALVTACKIQYGGRKGV